MARDHFEAGGVADRVEIRLGNAHDSLKKLANESPFDFVFIDAEKSGYPQYYEWAMENARVGGIIAAHNAFRAGAIVNPNDTTTDTEAMRTFNKHVAADPRAISTIYPGGDGMVVVVKIA